MIKRDGGGRVLRARRLPALTVAALVALVLLACSRTVDRPTKVIIVGVDAADWSVINPLLDEGKLPNLARLMKIGTSGNLETLWPLEKSPTLWTSIATGVLPDKHGIGGYVMPSEDGESLLYTRNVRRVRALWDILGEKSMRVAVVGWMVTWPAEEVNGYLVSDYVQYETERGIKVEKQTYPEGLFGEIDRFRLTVADLSDGDIRRFYPVDAPQDNTDVHSWRKDYVKMVYAVDETFRRIAHYLDGKGVDFLAVYFNGIDSLCHSFWDFRSDPTSPFADIINRYYIWMDSVLGEFMELAGRETLLVVCSDHGFHGARQAPDGGLLLGVYMHGRFGIVAMAGGPVRKAGRVMNASILDITPTILYALGYPVGRDMDGQVLTDFFTPEFIRTYPLEFVNTYETSPRHAEKPLVSPVDEKVKQKLKALGYIQ